MRAIAPILALAIILTACVPAPTDTGECTSREQEGYLCYDDDYCEDGLVCWTTDVDAEYGACAAPCDDGDGATCNDSGWKCASGNRVHSDTTPTMACTRTPHGLLEAQVCTFDGELEPFDG